MNPDQLRDELSANATQTTILRDQHQTLSNVSQDPVQRASPVGLTPKQEIRLLWPVKVHCCLSSPQLIISQQCVLKSPHPAKRIRPDREKSTEVISQSIFSDLNIFMLIEQRRSNIRQVESSDPVSTVLLLIYSVNRTQIIQSATRHHLVSFLLKSTRHHPRRVRGYQI